MIRVSYDLEHERYKVSLVNDNATTQTPIQFNLSDEEAERLINELERAGVSVTRAEDPKVQYLDGVLTATRAHLDDMRRLTFLENEKGEL